MKFSNRAKRLIGQGMFQVKAIAEELERAGIELLHFEIGDTCFDAPSKVKKSCIKAIKENKTHYTDPKGLYQLREAIAKIQRVDIENVAICPANFGIFASLSILCNKGDKIYYPIPGFPTYKAVAKYLGLKRGDGKVAIYNSPNNPTGAVYGLHASAEWLIEDCAYCGIFYGGGLSSKFIVLPNTKIIKLFSFSKTHAMPGFRLGYVIAPKEIIDKIGLLIETTYSCLPEFIQVAGIEALKGEQYKMKELKKRRDLMYKILKKHYILEKPQGAIYCWCKCDNEKKEVKKLLEKGIVVCPGSIFGKKNYIRFCFAKPIADIKKLGELL